MRITLGLALDGHHYPTLLGDRQACAGEAIVGPLGLLNLVETALGLSGRHETEPVRVAQYAARLDRANNGKRFYSASFDIDRVGVARLLLGWRDELVAAGWTAATRSGSSPRLADLAAVEAIGELPVSSGTADRLQGVLAEARLRAVPGVSVILLAEPLTHWSGPWRELLEALAPRRT